MERWAQSRLLSRPPTIRRGPRGHPRPALAVWENTLPPLVTTLNINPGLGAPRGSGRSARTPQCSRVQPPSSTPPPAYLCLFGRIRGQKKSVLTQCVCVCLCVLYWLGGKSAEAGNLLANPNLSPRRTRPGPGRCCPRSSPGPPEPRPFVRSRISSSVDAARLTKFFRFVLKTKGQANLGLSAPWPCLCRGAGSASRAFGQSCPVQGQTLRSPESSCGWPQGRHSPPTPLPTLPPRRNHRFLGEDTQATSTTCPKPPCAAGTETPALHQPLREGGPGNSPASAARLGSRDAVF